MYPDWVAGKHYAKGAIVRFPKNGQYYAAKNDNDGLDPTVSTWYWQPYAGQTSGTSAAASSGDKSYPDWAAGKHYAKGAVVRFPKNGQLYEAKNENDGLDPTVSTWYWQPYTGATGNAAAPVSSGGKPSSFVVSEAQFNQMFPNRKGFYTYAGLTAAVAAYPAFAGTGSATVRKQEAAAFLANVCQETGGLVYVVEINTANYSHYTDPSKPHPAGQSAYYGRGSLQLSWNYNYQAAGDALGLDLLNNPSLVEQDAAVAWKTGLWFWMTQSGAGKMTPHDAMVNSVGFAETIRSINGAVECGKNSPEMLHRVEYYKNFAQILGVPAGDNLTC